MEGGGFTSVGGWTPLSKIPSSEVQKPASQAGSYLLVAFLISAT